MDSLSNRQMLILDFIKAEVSERGYPPSVREIAKAVGLASSSTVHGHLAKIEEKGFIKRDPTKPRAIEIIEQDSHIHKDTARYIPVLGKVTAGVPITAVENIDEYVPVPGSSASDADNLFILVIEGDSMINAGIFDGDQVVVKQQNTAENGDIVVAMTDQDEATVKRFFKEKDHFRLQAENDALDPILLDSVAILGKVIGLYRKF